MTCPNNVDDKGGNDVFTVKDPLPLVLPLCTTGDGCNNDSPAALFLLAPPDGALPIVGEDVTTDIGATDAGDLRAFGEVGDCVREAGVDTDAGDNGGC